MTDFTQAGTVGELGPVFLDSVITENDAWSSDKYRVWNYPIAAADTMATSVVNLAPGLSMDSFVPSGFAAYHRSRKTYDAVGSTAAMMLGAGLMSRGIKAAGAAARVQAAAGEGGNFARMASAVLPDADRVARVDDLMGLARLKHSTSIAAVTGRTAPALAATAEVGPALAPYGRNMGEVADWVKKARTVNAIKEGVAFEVATVALFNNSEFLFPEGASAWHYALFGGLGVGANVGIEHVLGRAVQRAGMRHAALAGQTVAAHAIKNGGMFVEAQAVKGVVGEDWQNMVASMWGKQRLDELEVAAETVAAGSQGTLTKAAVLDTAREMRRVADLSIAGSIQRMGANRVASETLRAGHGRTAGVSRSVSLDPRTVQDLRARTAGNPAGMVGVAEFGDSGMAARWLGLANQLENEMRTLEKAMSEAKDLKAARELGRQHQVLKNKRAEVEEYRGATVEQTGVLNYNGERRQPFWEVNDHTSLRGGDNGLRFERASGRLGELQVNSLGQVLHIRKATPNTPGVMRQVPDHELDFNELTALYTMFGKATAKNTVFVNFKENFWTTFMKDPDAAWEKLPFPMLDAIASGRLPISASAATHPRAVKWKYDIEHGVVGAAALAKKLDWYSAHVRKAGLFNEGDHALLDVFDMEKALNLRLTDDRGGVNVLYDAIVGWSEGSLGSSALFGRPGKVVSDHVEDLINLGLGRGGRATDVERELAYNDVYTMLAGGGSLDAYTRPGGVGALVRRIPEPTDSEMQVAMLAARRNAVRADQLFNSKSEFVSSIAGSLREDEISFAGAQKSGAVFRDAFLSNNALSQTTWANRYQDALQHAHAVGQRAVATLSRVVDSTLTPLARKQKMIANSASGPATFAAYGQMHGLISRGVALVEDFWVPGHNVIDMSRPGAVQMLENLGPLAGAPAKGDPWLAFDVTIAANEGRYVPLSLSDEAADLLTDHTRIQYMMLDAHNALRKASGLPPLQKLKGHLAVDDFSRYHLRYVSDPKSGEVVGVVKGTSAQEADAELSRALGAINSTRAPGDHLTEIHVDLIREHKDAVDQVFQSRLTDFSGIRQTGAGKGRSIDFRMPNSPELLERHMVAMRNTLEDLKNRTVVSVFASSINEMERVKRSMVARSATGGESAKTFFTPIEQWYNVLTASGATPAEGLARRGHDYVTDVFNVVSGKVADAMPWSWRALEATLAGNGNWLQKRLTKGQRDWVEATLKDHGPFSHLQGRADLQDYLKIERSRDPYKLASILQRANRVASKLVLQHANIFHPVLNMLGAIVTLPGVLSSVTKHAGESSADFARRLGHLADYIDPERGVATISPGKLAAEAQHLFFNSPGDYAYAAKMGYLDANWLEELNKLANLSPTKFEDVTDALLQYSDVFNMAINKGMRATGREPSAFTISERSETFTRGLLHMAGLALVRRNGRQMSEGAQHAFAHYFANQNIADFAPNIRGEAFRGVAGIPFGLFQSFSINAYQRLFRYVENKDARTLAIQAATQAGIFGMSGLPGWDALNALYFNVPDMRADERGASSLNERIYAALGKGPADILMTGTVSNLPKLLGADSGINLYTSGDLNPTAPVIPPAVSIAMQAVQGGYEGMRRAAEQAATPFNGAEFDIDRLAEVVANYAPSRGFRSAADLFIGERVDRRGNLVVEDTRSGVALVSRLLGTKTTNEVQLSQAIWDNSQAQAQRVSDMARVRQQLLRSMRDGGLNEEESAHYLNRYLLAGGRQDQWARWLKNASKTALSTRDQRALDTLVAKSGEVYPHSMASMRRVQMAGGDLEGFLAAGGPVEVGAE